MPQETETPPPPPPPATAPADPATAPTTMPQSFRGLNHLKLASVDLGATATFYTTIFPFTYLPHYDHHRADGSVFAVMFRHEASGILVEARQNPAQAAAQVGWDPVTWGGRHPGRPGGLGAMAGQPGRGSLARAPGRQGLGAVRARPGRQDRPALHRGGARVGTARGR
ncbi:hypothetical protein PG988_007092 [Apiospora saccharicola]